MRTVDQEGGQLERLEVVRGQQSKVERGALQIHSPSGEELNRHIFA
jgi:hypothetical protein